MRPLEKEFDKSALKLLVPISALSPARFDQLADHTVIEQLASGQTLFTEGDTDPRAVYLLAGKVILRQGKTVIDTINGGSDQARYPLAHHNPRQLTAIAKGKISFVRIDTGLLDALLGNDGNASAYEVSETSQDDDWMSQLLHSDSLRHLPAGSIQSMLLRLEEIEVKQGDVIIREGEAGDYYYIMRQGSAQVTRHSEESDEDLVLAELHPGDPFGEEALIIDQNRNATITMLTKGIVMRLSKDDFDELMKTPLISWLSLSEAEEKVANGAKWLDVRMPDEVAEGDIPGSEHIPLAQLRSKIDSLDTGTTYITYCDSGRRSSVATFLLNQRGIESHVLYGGYQIPVLEEVTTTAENVIDFTAEQQAAKHRAVQTETETMLRKEQEKRAAMEAELAQLRAEHAMTTELAEQEANRREEAEAERARAIEEAKRLETERAAARRQADAEAQRRQQAEAEAEAAKTKAREAMQRAVEEAKKIKAEREATQRESEARLAALHEEREAARISAEQEARRLREEADAARAKLEEEAKNLRREREEARESARIAADRLQREQAEIQKEADEAAARMLSELEAARTEAEQEAQRLKQEALEARKHAEEEARKRSEALASEIMAEAEEKRLRVEQEAQKLLDEAEASRLQAKAELAELEASQAAARLKAEEDLARIQKESDAARTRAEEEARRQQEAEQARIEAEQEAKQAQSEAELVRKQAAEEASRLQAEAEKLRLSAEEEATRALAEAEQACLKAKEEAAQLSAQAEEARANVEDFDTAQEERVRQLEADAEAARQSAEQALEQKQQAEQARQSAEQEAARLKEEAEAARTQAEAEASSLISEAEQTRKQAEQEAEKIRHNALSAKEAAETMAEELKREAEEARQKMEAETERMRAEAAETRARAEAMSEKLRLEAEELSQAEQTDEIPELQETVADTLDESAQEVSDEPVSENVVIPAEPDDEVLQDIIRPEAAHTAETESLEIPDMTASEDSGQAAQVDDDAPLPVAEIEPEDETAGEPVKSGIDFDEMDALAAAVESELADQVKNLDEAPASPLLLGSEFNNEQSAEPEPSVQAPLQPVPDIDVDDELDEISQLIDEAGDKYSEFVEHETEFTHQLPQRKSNKKPVLIAAGIVAGLAVAGVIAWSVLSSKGGEEPSAVISTPQTSIPTPVPAETAPPTPPVATAPESEEPVSEPVKPAPKPETRTKPKPVKFVPPTPFRDSMKIGLRAPSLVKLPAGEFVMGSPNTSLIFDERPAHKVRLKAFAMTQYEITVGEYRDYLRATNKGAATAQGLGGKNNQPVVRVSWLDARDYARWLSKQTGKTYRLPSEAEWEYAAAAGATTNYWWGATVGKGHANCFNCGSQWDATRTAPVGSFKPNRYRLYDMAGNVAEWVADCRNRNYKNAPADGSAWLSGDCDNRMVRGGSFNSPSDTLRVRSRSEYVIDSRLDNIGFRLVRELK